MHMFTELCFFLSLVQHTFPIFCVSFLLWSVAWHSWSHSLIMSAIIYKSWTNKQQMNKYLFNSVFFFYLRVNTQSTTTTTPHTGLGRETIRLFTRVWHASLKSDSFFINSFLCSGIRSKNIWRWKIRSALFRRTMWPNCVCTSITCSR